MLVCVNLHKAYKRRGRDDVQVLKGVSLSVEKGQIYGLLGLNGAGKTTLMRILAGILKPDQGDLTVNGMRFEENEVATKQTIGVVLGGERSLYWKLTAKENLEFFGALYGINKAVLSHRIDEVLSYVHLNDKKDDLVETYSRGMKQRLLIAKALLSHPTILLLDEPTVGLDVQIAHQFRSLIQSLNKELDLTIFLTTHYLNEAEQLCSHIGILKDGVIIKEGTSTELADDSKYSRRIVASIKTTDIERLLDAVNEIGNVISYQRISNYEENYWEINAYLFRNQSLDVFVKTLHYVNAEIIALEDHEITLEDILLNI